SDAFGFSSSSPIVTSSGSQSGTALVWIVWSPDGSGNGAQLRAYDAVPVGGTLTLRFSAAVGTAAKFTPPGVANGRVYVGPRDGHVLGFGAPVYSTLSGSGFDFERVIVNTSAQTTLTVTASSPVTINTVSSSSASYVVGTTVPALPVSLPAGGTLQIPVTF